MPVPTYYGTVVGIWNEVFDPTANPYNADNTGATDATAAIRACINDAGAAAVANGVGATVRFPAGKYLVVGVADFPGITPIKRGIPIPQNVRVIAELGTVLITQPNNNNISGLFCSANYIPTATPSGEFYGAGVEGFIFDGNGPNQTAPTNQEQCPVLLLGARMIFRRNRIIRGGSPNVGTASNFCGLLMNAGVEAEPTGANNICEDNDYENCQGYSLWVSNLKGDTISTSQTGPAINSYGSIGRSSFSRNRVWYPKNGVFIEDRCNGFIADEIEVYHNPLTLATNGVGINVSGCSHGILSGIVENAGVGLGIEPNDLGTPCENLHLDVVVNNSYNAGVKMGGLLPMQATVTSNVAAGVSAIPLTVTQGSPLPGAGLTWLAIIDGGNSEWVQVSAYAAGSATLTNPTLRAHNAGVTVLGGTGLRNISGQITVRNACNGGTDTAGVVLSALTNSALTIRSYDARQQLFVPGTGPGTAGQAPTQLFGVSFQSQCANVVVYGSLSNNARSASTDDGTCTNCFVVGELGSVYDNANFNFAQGEFRSHDANVPSSYRGNAAPNANLGKNGDFFHNAAAPAGGSSAIYQRRAGAWVGIA